LKDVIATFLSFLTAQEWSCAYFYD